MARLLGLLGATLGVEPEDDMMAKGGPMSVLDAKHYAEGYCRGRRVRDDQVDDFVGEALLAQVKHHGDRTMIRRAIERYAKREARQRRRYKLMGPEIDQLTPDAGKRIGMIRGRRRANCP